MKNTFYITTPIYYVNDLPHIGHAYTSIAADILARYHRMAGRRVLFLTGTDEHGQKVEQAASARGLKPKEHADQMVENYKAGWKALGLTHDAFIRTTDEAHKEIVRGLLSKLYESKLIERRSYTGWYCTPCERFWTEKDLKDGNCPECGRAVEKITEENYFFLMSRYHDALIDYITDHPDYIMPETRKNEVLGFLRSQPLQDLCISRPKKRLSWGIPLPFDEEYVTYVWFDALVNYYTGATNRAYTKDADWWPADVHLVGKDILTTHAVYWSTMLMALGLPLPKHIYAHGWWTIEGRKMSKSLGNVVNPMDVVKEFGNDAFRYFLFRELHFGLDGDYSREALTARFNTDLANDFGNLASRAIKMAERYFGSRVPEPAEVEQEMKALADAIPGVLEADFRKLQFNRALDEIWKLVTYTNKYIDTMAPWVLAKDPATEPRLRTVIYSSLEAVRLLSVHLHPFMPEATEKLHKALGGGGLNITTWGGLKPGTQLQELPALFPRIEIIKTDKKEQKKEKKVDDKPKTEAATAAAPAPKPVAPSSEPGVIGIEDFMKVELKTAKVITAERVPKSEKLIRLEVDSGEPEGALRQVVAGIGKAYAPEDLVGRTIIIVANLKPAKLMGVESRGMLLAATDADGVPVILGVEKSVSAGLRVK